MNEDGQLDILDVVVGINIILDIDDPTEAQLWALDLNEDGDTNILDLVIMVNAILDGDWDCEEASICDGLTEVELWGEWYHIESTTYINLNQQGLTGSIPPEIGCLTDLTYLNLSWNVITGEIPPEVCDLIESNNLYMDYILNGNNLINTCE